MNFEIAIPTYNRPSLIETKTLAYLERSKFPPDRVTIWLSDPAQKAIYYACLPARWRERLRDGRPSLTGNRWHAEQQYEKGTRLLWIDDDVKGINRLTKDGKQTKEIAIDDVAEEGFRLADEAGAKLWGIYPTNNAYFMSEKTKTGLVHIVGCCYGVEVSHDPGVQPQLGDGKEDYERSLRHYERDGKVLRLNYVAPVTKYSYSLQQDKQAIEAKVQQFEKMWPKLVHRNKRRNSGVTEILLKEYKAK